jgi:hypothetical protein
VAKYDLAISFAGEQRGLAESLAQRLDASGYSIFYDRFESAELWGTDLSLKLAAVYGTEARYCLVIVSIDYLKKPWTNFERQNAISRFMQERTAYLLCLRTDEAELPGLPPVIGYVELSHVGEDGVYELLLRKLGRPDHSDRVSHLSESDREIAKGILEACYRRAVYTRMASEINMQAMARSLSEAHRAIQPLVPRIGDQSFQRAALKIIAALDEIERVQARYDARFSLNLDPEARAFIDTQKREIIRLLLEIRRAALIPMQLPFSLRTDHFHYQADADAAPTPRSHDWD